MKYVIESTGDFSLIAFYINLQKENLPITFNRKWKQFYINTYQNLFVFLCPHLFHLATLSLLFIFVPFLLFCLLFPLRLISINFFYFLFPFSLSRLFCYFGITLWLVFVVELYIINHNTHYSCDTIPFNLRKRTLKEKGKLRN